MKSCLGLLSVTDKQAKCLGVKSHRQLSPYLEKCCLRVSANVSYENAAKDVELFTGVKVSANTQQRLVHRSEFKRPTASSEVEELSVDGGKIRLRTQKGEPCSWRDYKGVRLHEQGTQAFFQDNSTLVDWVNHQSIAAIVTCC